MLFELTPPERASRARSDLRMGRPVAICDGERAIVFAVPEVITEQRLTDLRALGDVVMCITAWRARTLHMPIYENGMARFDVPSTARLAWAKAVADPMRDLDSPLKGPFNVQRTAPGDDLFRAALQLVKSARLLPAVVAVIAPPPQALTQVHLTDIANDPMPLAPVAGAHLPISPDIDTRLNVFRPADDGDEHYALTVRRPDLEKPVLTRLHSACFTGDVLGSLKCDCGAQLAAAISEMDAQGGGILLYLNQEGRGIGLNNKMRAYALQDQGFDTVEANHRLGFEDDERDFRIGAQMLKRMGVQRVRLLTNNPAKLARLTDEGIDVVERVPLRVGKTAQNAHYLATKAAKSGHNL